MTPDADALIRVLGLQPHPEGGHFVETYRSDVTVPAHGLPSRYGGPRSCSTAILFLLRSGEISALHRLRSDELWHYHAGDSARLAVLHPDGRLVEIRLGPRIEHGEQVQVAVPAGCWFGGRVDATSGFVLVGCTVSPGFSYEDFELGRRDWLLREYPQHEDVIVRLTRA